MRLDLAAIGNEPYRKARPSEDIIIRNRRAQKYSKQVEAERIEKLSRLGALSVLILLIIGCAVCGVY